MSMNTIPTSTVSQETSAPSKNGGVSWVYGMALLLSLVVFGLGTYLAATDRTWSMLAAGCVCIVGVLVTWPLALGAYQRAKLAAASSGVLLEASRAQLNALERISEQQLISDRAKSVAFREKDRDAFRRAIEEDVAKNDYEAALALTEQMDREFGYKFEADRLRAEVLLKRDAEVDRQIDAAMVLIDRHVASEQWQSAYREAEKLRARFPSSARAEELPSEIEARRQAVKKQLHARLVESDRVGHFDEGIAVLRKLDAYLTPVEATQLEDVARRLFKNKLTQLGDAFRNAAGSRKWNDAIRISNQIIAEFPNTQMAKEAKDMLPTLEQRQREEAESQQPLMAGA